MQTFEFKKSSTEGAILTWVGKARSTDEKREVLQYIRVDGEAIVATDGRRMHIHYRPVGFEVNDGIYKMVSSGKSIMLMKLGEDIFVYPNWKQVIPTNLTNTVKWTPSQWEKSTSNEYMACINAYNATKGGRFNIDYLLDAVYGCPSMTFYGLDEFNPLMIQTEQSTAIIMPMRV